MGHESLLGWEFRNIRDRFLQSMIRSLLVLIGTNEVVPETRIPNAS